MNIFNSRVVQKLIVEYQVSPTAQGELTIPEFTVDTDQGNLNVPAAKFDITEATVGNTGMRPEDIFKSELSAYRRFDLRRGNFHSALRVRSPARLSESPQ